MGRSQGGGQRKEPQQRVGTGGHSEQPRWDLALTPDWRPPSSETVRHQRGEGGDEPLVRWIVWVGSGQEAHAWLLGCERKIRDSEGPDTPSSRPLQPIACQISSRMSAGLQRRTQEPTRRSPLPCPCSLSPNGSLALKQGGVLFIPFPHPQELPRWLSGEESA